MLGCVLLGLLAPGPIALAAPGHWTAAAGVHYATGHYGGKTPIETLYVPLTLRWDADGAQASLTVPYLELRGHGTSVPGGVVLDSRESGQVRTSGLGDVVAAAGYTLFRGTAPLPWVDLTAGIKFGTADPDKQLGTGKNDYTLQADAYQNAGRIEWFATLGYREPGSPRGVEFNNVYYAYAGASYALTAALKTGLMWRGQEPLTTPGYSQGEATTYASWAISAHYWLQAYYSRGLTQGSADWATGATLGRPF